MNKEFVLRGQTASGLTETLNFSGAMPGYAYRMTEFRIFPGTNITAVTSEMVACVTAANVAEDPLNPNFNHKGLIATAFLTNREQSQTGYDITLVNDTFLITQDLLLKVECAEGPVNWQCRFVAEKVNNGEEAVANYNQFVIFDN